MNFNTPARAYNQGARAQAAAETHRRVLQVFTERLQEAWLEDITLEEVADGAEVTVQTVIRRFGGKEGLLSAAAQKMGKEIAARREAVEAGEWEEHVRTAVADYEITGTMVLRLLAQEERWQPLKPVLALGRDRHRGLIARVYRPWLDRLPGADARRTLAGLVAATDVYTWRLLRLDQGLSEKDAVIVMKQLVRSLISIGASATAREKEAAR